MRGRIEKRVGKHGVSYRVRIDLGDDPVNGARKRPSQTFPTRKAAEEALAKWLGQLQAGTFVEPHDLTVAEYLVQWEETLAETVRPPTARRYKDLLQKHAVPTIGGIKLIKLTPLDIQRLYANRLAAGLSPATVNLLHNVLHRALKQAVRWGIVNRNVTELAVAPRRAEQEMRSWDAAQVARFFAVADEDEYAALWRLAILGGLRRGELLGLKWEDVDLRRGTLHVQRTYSRLADSGWGEGPPKTRSSRRVIALPQSVLDALRLHRTKQLELRLQLAATYQDRGFVFTTFEGRPVHVNSLMYKFGALTQKAGVAPIRFHDLRHTSATLSLADGMHPKIVQERLGHSSIAMTLDRYSHATLEMQRQAAERLERMITEEAQKGTEPEGEAGNL
jgi:integrase